MAFNGPLFLALSISDWPRSSNGTPFELGSVPLLLTALESIVRLLYA
jgi:hypothetical protein